MKHYEMTIIPKSGYLHAVVTGENTPETVAAYLSELLGEIVLSGCQYVLLEERLDGPRIGISDVFQVASEGSKKTNGIIRAMAYVDVNATDDTMKFAEMVATNRSMPLRVFLSVDDAERWLQTEVSKQ